MASRTATWLVLSSVALGGLIAAQAPVYPNGATLAPTKIATLGGPPVTIEAAPPAKTIAAKPDKSVIKKRAEALRKARHRRLMLQARVVQQLPQQPTDRFGRPLPIARHR